MTHTDDTLDAEPIGLFERMCACWTAGDADGYGACFTEDCDCVSYDGTHARGRRDVVANHDRLFRAVLTGSALVGEAESVRQLREDVAVLHATGSVQMPWRASLPNRRLSRQTTVAVKTDGGWRVAALHNGRVRPVRISAPDSFPARASRAMSRAAGVLHIGRAR